MDGCYKLLLYQSHVSCSVRLPGLFSRFCLEPCYFLHMGPVFNFWSCSRRCAFRNFPKCSPRIHNLIKRAMCLCSTRPRWFLGRGSFYNVKSETLSVSILATIIRGLNRSVVSDTIQSMLTSYWADRTTRSMLRWTLGSKIAYFVTGFIVISTGFCLKWSSVLSICWW